MMEKPQQPVRANRTNKLEIVRRIDRKKTDLEEVYSSEVPCLAKQKNEVPITYQEDFFKFNFSRQ